MSYLAVIYLVLGCSRSLVMSNGSFGSFQISYQEYQPNKCPILYRPPVHVMPSFLLDFSAIFYVVVLSFDAISLRAVIDP